VKNAPRSEGMIACARSARTFPSPTFDTDCQQPLEQVIDLPPQAMAYCLSDFRSAGNNPVHPVNPV